jgi:hypothetical protein
MTYSMRSKRIFAGPRTVDDVPRRHPATGRTRYPACGPMDSRPVRIAGDRSALGAQAPRIDRNVEGDSPTWPAPTPASTAYVGSHASFRSEVVPIPDRSKSETGTKGIMVTVHLSTVKINWHQFPPCFQNHGYGRSPGLKIQWGDTRVGSSPTFGTKDLRQIGTPGCDDGEGQGPKPTS